MTDDKPIYISAEDDITTVRERISNTANRHVTLIVPEQSQLRSLTAWRILHKRVRELGKEVAVISTDPLVRSVAKEANFSVASSPSAPTTSKASKSRPPSRPGRPNATGRASGAESVAESGTPEKVSEPRRTSTPSTSLKKPQTGPTAQTTQTTQPAVPQTEQFHDWYREVPRPLPFRNSGEQATSLPDSSTEPVQHATTDALFSAPTSLGSREPYSGQIVDLSGEQTLFGRRPSTQLAHEQAYSVDDEDYEQAERIRNSLKGSVSAPQTPLSPSSPSTPTGAALPSSALSNYPSVPPTTPPPQSALNEAASSDIADSYPAQDINGIRDIRDIHDLRNESYDADVLHSDQGYAQPRGGDPSYRTAPLLSQEENDPYAQMEDDTPAPHLIEQHASATVDGLDTSEHAIQGDTLDSFDGVLEDLGENDGISPSLMSTPIKTDDASQNWGDPLSDEEQADESGPARPARPTNRTRRENRGTRSPQSQSLRSGQLRQQSQAREPRTYGSTSARPEVEDPDYLPPVEERTTVQMSPREVQEARSQRTSGKFAGSPAVTPSVRTSKALQRTKGTTGAMGESRVASSAIVPPEAETARREPQPVPIRNATSPVPAKPRQPVQTGQQGQQVNRTPTRASGPKPTRQLPPQRRSGGVNVVIPIVVLLLLLLGILAYFVPTATVTVALPAKAYAQTVVLKAGSGGGVQSTEQLSNDFFATGVGKATGTTSVGLAPASGSVTFTNAGNKAITIPAGTVITTASGVAFTTQAEAVVTEAGNTTGNPIEIPVQAQSPGKNGNVDAGTITVIPGPSLSSIAQANSGTSAASLKLSVVNSNPTTGGGTGTAPAVTQQDINATKANLDKSVNVQYQTWLKQHVASTDLAGVLTQTDAIVSGPTAGSAVAGDGTFTQKVRLSVTIAIIRAATLQQESAAQMNQGLKSDKTLSAYTMVTDSQHPIQVEQLKTSSDGKTVTFNFKAVGKAVPNISTQQVQRLIVGKSIADARTVLLRAIPGVSDVSITTGPKIGNWSSSIVPWWTNHIYVHLVASS